MPHTNGQRFRLNWASFGVGWRGIRVGLGGGFLVEARLAGAKAGSGLW